MLDMHYFDIAVTHSVDFRGKIEFCEVYVKRSVLGLSEGVEASDVVVGDRRIAWGAENTRVVHNGSVTDYRQKHRHHYLLNSGKTYAPSIPKRFYRKNSQVKSFFGEGL